MKLKDINISFKNKHTQNALAAQGALYEGLIKSYHPSQLMRSIEQIDPNVKSRFNRHNPGVMNITINPSKTNTATVNQIIHKIEVCGWFPAIAGFQVGDQDPVFSKDINKIVSELDWIAKQAVSSTLVISIEAKYGYDVTEDILKRYEFLYHVTPTHAVPKIMKIGLTPKTRSKLANHPDRIYLALTRPDIEHLIPQFQKATGIKEWTTLQIDISFLKNSGQGRLFEDPAFSEGGVYTLANINPMYIHPLKPVHPE